MKYNGRKLGYISYSRFRVTPLLPIMFLVITLLFLPACTGPPREPPPPEPTQPEPPQAGLEASATSGQAPLTVTFSNTSQNADEFRWDFGDGVTETSTTVSEAPSHEYTKAGTHTVTLTATRKGEPSQTSTATLTITVNPGALHAVTVPPIQIAAGEAEQLVLVGTDQYGNRVSEVDVTWTLTNENAGSLTQAGLHTAAEVAGIFKDAVEVEIKHGEVVQTVTASVTITPSPLEQVVIAPNPAEIGMEMTQQFVAVGADKYGNRIAGLAFTWSVENGGTIDASGLFTAGDTPGSYNDTIKAEATQGNITQSATASVTVEPDRIAFISDRNDDQKDIYIMNVDGTNVERLTTTPALERLCSWSPDGRRIIYDSYRYTDGILAMTDSGKWTVRLIANIKDVAHIYPTWSLDGSKIAFVKASVIREGKDIDNLDIFVMDVDGGNVTQLTDTSDGDEWVPAWSPDGTKLVYDFTPKGKRGDIYFINADGSNRKRLTSHVANDTGPLWSPDGTQITFRSNRDGDYEIYVMDADGTNIRQLTSNTIDDVNPAWSHDGSKIVFASKRHTRDKFEIYVMDAYGSNVTRLTDNSAQDSSPRWAPRKRGVEVTEASVIIPGASPLKAVTVQDVTAQARKAVVRIKTELATGSGFVIDPSGLILTNNHVIRDAKEITVYFEDGTSYEGSIEARDLIRDLAIVRIMATGLPSLELGDLSQVSLGQPLAVVGYPLDAESVTVTSGLASLIAFDSGRNITWVQTDSAINPGNSGGPMLDLQCRVIGVVSAKMVGIAIERMGFAISANTVKTYLPTLKAGETIRTFD